MGRWRCEVRGRCGGVCGLGEGRDDGEVKMGSEDGRGDASEAIKIGAGMGRGMGVAVN